MKLRSFISRLQELNACLEEVSPDTEGQGTAHRPADEIMDIIYHSMPTTWENKMIEQGFNYTDSTVKEMSGFFDARVKSLKPKEEKKKSSAATKETKDKKVNKKSKRADSNSSVGESSEESSLALIVKKIKKLLTI